MCEICVATLVVIVVVGVLSCVLLLLRFFSLYNMIIEIRREGGGWCPF